MDPQSLIAGYSKHTPKLLRQQILCELLKQYLTTPAPAGSHGETPLVKCMPSVQRFHGAMLFVDISGFTALSLRLDVETLKNHINMYFSKMLDIVEKWDGDVIKFAGDALFIIWPTAPLPASSHTDNDSISRLSARNSMDSKHFTQAARRALEKAVACGLEISAECGNYEVKLTDSSSTSPSKTEASSGGGGLVNKFLKLGSFLSGSRVSPGNDDVAYLDVHSGVSCGLMAGIDVVHGTRGEFFLVGEPLIGVAMAESQAMKGDVVLDTTAHDVLHGTKTNFSEEEGEEVMLQSPQFKQMGSGQQAADLPCGCVCTPSGLFVVKKLITRVSKGGLERRKTRSQLKVELIQQRSEHHSLSLKTYEDVVQDVEELFLTARPSMRKAFYQYLKNSDVGGKYSEFTFLEFMQNHIKKHFEENMHGALLEYATLHVHEVERRGALSGSTQKRRNSSFHDIMDSSRHLLTNFTTISKLIDSVNTTVAQHSPVNTQSSTAQAEHNARIKNKDSELDDASKLAERNKRRHRASISSFAAEVNNGEIRTIIVMFVKIERFDLHLKVDNFSKVAYSNRFVFLDRTESELEADDTLLNRLQACFAVLCDAFHEHGGQLRQFIVDDKGTVCIGTFGLRGSTAVDNAASAMEASKYIIDNMKRVDLHAHIGITSGKAYCGLVGSSVRHEYAVMGPSTNLAARLMCKARLNSVICDADTADRDRTHKFDALQEIQAKGYSQPVMIYRPMFNHREESFTMRNFRFLSSRNMAAVGTKKKKKRSLKAVVAMVTYTRMLSAKSLVPKQSFTERMLALCTTDFHISPTKTKHEAAGNERSVVTNKLFGRQRELVDVFQSLFDDDVRSGHVLSTGHKMNMVVLSGVIGIGKGAMLNAIERKLQYLARADKTCPMAILRNRHNVLQKKDTPLGIWQVMLRKLFLSFRKIHLERIVMREEQEKNQAAAGGESHSSEVPPLATANTLTSLEGDGNFDDVINAIRHLIPDNLHAGLLMLLEWTSDEVALDYVSSLSSQDSAILQQLIVCSVKAYVEIVKKFVLIIIESMQLLDPTSSHVLQSMYKECMGVGVLMGYTISSTESHQKTDEEGASELGGAFQPFYLVDTDRLKVIHLDSLDKEATISLAREVASDISYEQIDDIFEQSNGRPLYIAELVKNQIAKPNEKTEMGEKVNNARIEEVVCYRIDQLQLPLQIILKACAVAASYSNSFTLSMLKFILANDAHFYQQTTQSEPPAMRLRRAISKAISISGIRSMAPPTCTVEQALAKLLQEEDFLTISGTQLEKKDIEADELHKYTLVFQVPLEQTIIYGLIVDEQKEFFHERVALRIHSSIISEQSEAVKQSSLWEVGFHWDAATLWSRALRSYVQAAKRCRIEGGSQLRITECLLMAYQTYQHLEQEVGILELPQSCHQHIDLLFTCLLAPSHEAFIQLEGQFELLLAIKPAIDIFEHDTEALSFAVLLHIMLVDAYLQQWEDIAEVTRVLMVGIILAVAEQYRKYLQQTRMSEDHVERESQKRFLLVSVVEDEYVPPKRTLVYTDFVRMLTQTQFCMQYCSDMSYLVSKTVLSFLEGRDAQPEAWFPLQCQLLQALRHVQTGNMLDAQLVIDSVVYDPAVHSSTLASMYSVDLMPYLLALLGRGLILLNGSASGTGYLTRCFSYLDGVSHGLSRTIAAVVCASIEDYLSTGSVFSLDQTLSNDWNASVVRIIRAWYNVRQSSDSRPCTPLTMEQYGEMFKAADRLSADRTTVCMLTFMEINGLVVDRMLFDIAASLFNSRSREQRLLLDQHLLAWLKALLLSPAHNYMTMVAKGCNLLAALAQVVHLQGSSAMVFISITEKSEQPLLQLLQMVRGQGSLLLCKLLCEVTTDLTLHQDNIESYRMVCEQCNAKFQQVAEADSEGGKSLEEHLSVARQKLRIGALGSLPSYT